MCKNARKQILLPETVSGVVHLRTLYQPMGMVAL